MHRASVAVGTLWIQIQTGLSIPGFSHLDLPGVLPWISVLQLLSKRLPLVTDPPRTNCGQEALSITS